MRIQLVAEMDEVNRYLNQVPTAIEQASDQAVFVTTDKVKQLGRTQIQAGLSGRAANTFQSRLYFDTRGTRVRPSGFVHGTWFRQSATGDVTDVLHEFTTGATVVPVKKRALAIPTPEGLRLAGAIRGSRISPEWFKQRTGLELKAVDVNGTWYLVATGYLTRRNRVFGFKGGARRTRGGFKQGAASIFVFRLTKRTRLPRRLHLDVLEDQGNDIMAVTFLDELGKRVRL